MSGRADELIYNLKAFGLSEDEASTYISLVKHDFLTALAISKELKIARTKAYRLLEKLIEKGLVIEEVRDYGSKYRAASYEMLNQFIQSKEEELELLKTSAPNLYNQLAKLSLQASGEYKILHYRGIEGLKQVSWNSTKVVGDFRIYEVDLLHAVVDHAFAEKCRVEFGKKKNSIFYQITNNTSFPNHTNVTEHIKNWQVRHIPKTTLDIKFEIQIYNNVTSMFEYTNEDIFIVEICNDNLAAMQKQIFDIVWSIAKPMTITSRFGEAKLA